MATMAFTYNHPPRVPPPNTISPQTFPITISLSFPSFRTTSLCALKTSSDGYSGGDLLRKPEAVQPAEEVGGVDFPAKSFDEIDDDESWVDWEDKILEDTVPLVGFVRMILHSGKYESGDRLSPGHEKSIIERLLQYHPEREKKIGSGIDYITIGYHPDFEGSRCLFIVRKDGEMVDFSYWKCIKSLIRKNYPLYADSFILRHFRRRTRG